MPKIAAFVGHSFLPDDEGVVRRFLDYLDDIKKLGVDFSWDHAEAAEPIELSKKVKQKMADKNLFIGICTHREIVMANRALSTIPLTQLAIVNQKSTRLKTSDWILQEIGMAIGRNMDLILLVESGIENVGGLQGDIEYIEFSRNSLDGAFQRILQMIRALKPKETATLLEPPGEESDADKLSEAQDNKVDKEGDFYVPDDEWTTNDYVNRLFLCVHEKNSDREKQIREAFGNSPLAQDNHNVVTFEASGLYFSNMLRGENNYAKLRALCHENPDHPLAHEYLAAVSRMLDDYKHAVEAELKCIEQVDEWDSHIRHIFRAAEDYLELGNIDLVDELVLRAQQTVREHPTCAETYFSNRSSIAKKLGRVSEFLAFGERTLMENPADEDLRFRLAYAYSDEDLKELAFYHYGIVTRQGKNAGALNNLGVAADALSMSGKAVQSYKRAVKAESARAHGNLAHKLLTRGFLDEADDYCKRGTELDSADSTVAEAISRLDEIRGEEEDTKKEVLEKANIIQNFYLEFCGGLDAEPLSNVPSGRWKINDEPVLVSIADNRFSAIGSYEKERQENTLVRALARSSPVVVKETITIAVDGAITGRAVRANYERASSRPTGGLLSGIPINRDVLLIMGEDTIKMLDVESGKAKISEWESQNSSSD